MRYAVIISQTRKMYADSLDEARLKAIRHINERHMEVLIYRTPVNILGKPYGIIGFDTARQEYYWDRNGTVYFLNWHTGAVIGRAD